MQESGVVKERPQNIWPHTDIDRVSLKLNFNKMAKYKCSCSDREEEISKVTISVKDGEVVSSAQCPCGKTMELSEPKVGFPSLGRMNRNGSSY